MLLYGLFSSQKRKKDQPCPNMKQKKIKQNKMNKQNKKKSNWKILIGWGLESIKFDR